MSCYLYNFFAAGGDGHRLLHSLKIKTHIWRIKSTYIRTTSSIYTSISLTTFCFQSEWTMTISNLICESDIISDIQRLSSIAICDKKVTICFKIFRKIKITKCNRTCTHNIQSKFGAKIFISFKFMVFKILFSKMSKFHSALIWTALYSIQLMSSYKQIQ